MKNKTINLIVLDGGAYHYYNKMPFVQKMASAGQHVKYIVPPLGFSEREVIFTGKTPAEIGKFTIYCFSDRGPFRWARVLSWLPVSGNGFMEKAVRRFIRKVTEWVTEYYKVYTHQVPIKYLPQLDYQDDKDKIEESLPLFQEFKKDGVSVNYCMWPIGKSDDDRMRLFTNNKGDFNVIQFSDVDTIGHKFGPYSKEMKSKLEALDTWIESIYQEDEIFIVLGDHGMVPVEKEIDVMKMLQASEFSDIIPIVDSTLIRLNVTDSDLKKRVTQFILEKLGEDGEFLTKDKAEKYQVGLTEKEGGIVFLLHPGRIFTPSFYHTEFDTIMGMHGYYGDTVKDNCGFLVTNKKVEPLEDKENIKLVEVYNLLV